MVNLNKQQYIKLTEYNDKDVYINKEYITRIHQKTEELIEIQLINQTSIYVKEENLEILLDKIIS